MDDDARIMELRAHGARIGRDVFLGADVYIERDFAPMLIIEDGVVLSRGVSILLHDSALNNVAGEPLKFGQVILRENCYIGVNTTILCGVEIGARAVVGACALVTDDIPAEMVAYGQPARVRGKVADLIEKHRQMRTSGARYYYLDLIPWRDRRHDASDKAAELIHSFLRSKIAEERCDSNGESEA
jgi:carbonic anhydrase/acetyltransferase-like protein (isoleucine patch superfamily)